MTADLPADWYAPDNRALALRQHVLGLPLEAAAILITVTAILVVLLHYIPLGLFLFSACWSLGKVMTLYDPFALPLLYRNLLWPTVLRA